MRVREILVSRGYGAGWSSWDGGTKEQQLFMLTYSPFIEHLRSGGELLDTGTLWNKFVFDWAAAFPDRASDVPYSGGLNNCEVVMVEGEFLIHEYDGLESVRLKADVDLNYL